MSDVTFEGFPAFVQIVLPAPAADVIQRGLRLANDTFLAEQLKLEDLATADNLDDAGVGNLRVQIAEVQKVINQLDMLAEFFDDVASNPAGYPVRGAMSASIKSRQRQWKAAQPKRPKRKKGQTRRAYEARVARWTRARQEDVKAYNEAVQALVAADLPVDQPLLDAIVQDGKTVAELLEMKAEFEAEQEASKERYAQAMAVLAGEPDEPTEAEDGPSFASGYGPMAPAAPLSLVLPPGVET